MILLDTSVIIDYWRKPRRVVERALTQRNPCLCGVVLSELLQGAANERDVERTEQALSGFPCIDIPEGVWRELGLNLSALRQAGLKVPFQDALLATVALVHGMELWTLDAHFKQIQTVLKELNLFEIPR